MTQTQTCELIETQRPSSQKEAHNGQAGRRWLIVVLVLLAVLGVLAVEIRSRVKAATNLRAVTAQMAVPSVSVVLPKQTAPAQEVVLPGNIQPYISSPIYARTDGYLKKWFFDIGAHVRAGYLLAIIQTPEVDEQLAQAKSTLATAQANLELAQITRDRYEFLLKKHAVAQQDADNAASAYTANKAVVDADTANVATTRPSFRSRRSMRRSMGSSRRATQILATLLIPAVVPHPERTSSTFPDANLARLCECARGILPGN